MMKQLHFIENVDSLCLLEILISNQLTETDKPDLGLS